MGPQTDLPTAPGSVWDDIIAEYPQAKEFRTRPLLMYNELDQIFSGTTATDEQEAYLAPQDSQLRSPVRPPDTNAFNEYSPNAADDDNDSNGDSDEREEKEEQENGDFPRRRRVHRTSLSPAQTDDYDAGSFKRQKSTGEMIAQAILALADAHKALAVTTSIKEFKDQLASTIEVGARFRFIQLLATNQNAVTMYCGMDDECRRYFVQEFLAGNTNFQ